MKRLAIATVLIITALIIGSQLKAQEQPRRASPQPQTVRIYVEDKGGRSAGSGGLIAQKLVVTCNHVVKDRKSERVTIQFPDWQLVEGTVVKIDSEYDLALILLDKPPQGVLPFNVAPLKPKQPLSIQGYAYGPYKQSWGILNDSTWGVGWRMVEGPVARSGDSGGPVINEEGAFVGTLWGSAADDGTYFTPADIILKLAAPWIPDSNNDYVLTEVN